MDVRDQDRGVFEEPSMSGVDASGDSGETAPASAPEPSTVLRLVSGEDNDTFPPFRPESERSEGPYQFPVDVSDRRKHRRFPVARQGKVLRRSTQQYYRASSIDVSYSGALVELEHAGREPEPRSMRIGELVDVGLAIGRSAVVPSAALLQGMVVRVEPGENGRQRVAIRYLHASPTAKAA